ncbi:unnamed protein product [Anisakis simplex]|uniref:Sulfatase domain-containing protein n=1 Tax=Anisakis simplex TaxID=6269 RepID=A0A0M3KFF9_ANISI|nr:unnamed protein product [Anisakis simplex]
MGDHGLRFGPQREAGVGKFEDYNPMLMIAVPKFLRANNQLMTNMRNNAFRHTSNYDVYATLVDIAKIGKKNAYKNWDYHDFRRDFGDKRGARAMSLFRPIPYDRTCEEMEIDEKFCLCYAWTHASVNSDLVRLAGYTVIDSVNRFLESENISSICAKLKFTEVIVYNILPLHRFVKFHLESSK